LKIISGRVKCVSGGYEPRIDVMRSLLFLLAGFPLLLSGCADRPEVPRSAYGTVLVALPDLEKAKEPFPFPMEGDNDHQNCVFDESEF